MILRFVLCVVHILVEARVRIVLTRGERCVQINQSELRVRIVARPTMWSSDQMKWPKRSTETIPRDGFVTGVETERGGDMLTKMCEWIAYKLPREIVYYCLIRAGAEATTTVYADKCPDEVSIMALLDSWYRGPGYVD